MQPFTVERTVAKPREQLFSYLADAANHPEFTDHFLSEWRMTREETAGVGAGGRFKAKLPFARFPWGDWTIVRLDEPATLVLQGRTGKFNRIRTLTVIELIETAPERTRVVLTAETQPRYPSDRLLEALGQRSALRRHWRRALRRLQMIFEEDRGRGPRATIAGGPRKPASRLSA
ncbi:unannotated protein [freshwater metagenome]|uniref:Unannotated protein n=1 Tax=freshwater metagenome TaxID=449393 RepID=A0A6J7DXI9_9ZZZZ|nr:hypothetical protein [Actinomycetota bacterium]